VEKITGSLSVTNKITGKISTNRRLVGNISMPIAEAIEIYHGAHVVAPSVWRETTLRTKNYKVTDNITVEKIFYAEVSNESGGLTATIGDEFNA
jgi:hypothetical protein